MSDALTDVERAEIASIWIGVVGARSMQDAAERTYLAGKRSAQEQLAAAEQQIAALRAQRDRDNAEIEGLLWNLGGCDSVANGWLKPEEESKCDPTMVRPALISCFKMARELAALRADAERYPQTVALLRDARDWMNKAIGASWTVHDMQNPPLFAKIDAAIDAAREAKP